MRINHNIAALNTHRQLSVNNGATQKSLEKLSSGYRINRAGDDAAGLAISEKMRGQIRGLDMASKNAQDSISLIQTAEGALNETHSILQRMRELAVQASNDTNVSIDRSQIQKEINQLTSEINRIGNATEFNTMKLLNGDRSAVKSTGTTSSRAYVDSKTYDVYTALGITDNASSLDLATNITIGTSSGDGFAWSTLSSTSATSILSISKDAAGNLAVSISAQTIGGSQILDVSDSISITWDASDKYTYNSHGISFTIKKSDFDAASTNTKEIDLVAAVGSANLSGQSISTQNSWTTNGGQFKMAGGVTINSTGMTSAMASSIGSITIQAASSVAGHSQPTALIVTIKDISGNTLVQDVVSDSTYGSGMADNIKYNEHGISFTVSANGNSQTSGTMTINLDRTTSTVNLTSDASISFQVGANQDQSMNLSILDMRSKALGISMDTSGSMSYTKTDGGTDTIKLTTAAVVTNGTNSATVEFAVDVSTFENATKAVTVFNNGLQSVSEERAKLGAVQNRLEHTIANLDTSAENLQASESRIRDVDMAKEMMDFTKNNILQQAAQAMLAQANQQPQGVLQLLR